MDDEILRRQVFDEIQTQFETKLRDAKRQKSQAEEELESVSERCRTERRRLNSEIDQLESALAEAKSARRREPNSVEIQGADPQEVARIQAAADDRVKQAETNWESERGKLRHEISRLQASVAEIIERSNNPIRNAQQGKEQFQIRIDDAVKATQQVEEKFDRARNLWDEEKLRMTAEILELQSAPSDEVLKSKPDDAKHLKDLDKKAADAAAERATADREHARERQLLNTRLEEGAGLLEQSKAEILQLQRALAETKAAMSKDAGELDARLAASHRGRETAGHEHAQELQLFNSRLEQAAAELDRSKAEILQLQGALAETKAAMSRDAGELDARLAASQRGRETADLEHAQELQLCNSRLEQAAAELDRSKAEILELQGALAQTKAAMSRDAGELDARLAASQRDRETADREHALERQLLNSRLEEAASQLELSNAEILRLQRSLAETQDAMTGTAGELDARLAASHRDRETADRAHALEREVLNARLEESAAQLELSKAETLQLQHALIETKEAMNGNTSALEAQLAGSNRDRIAAGDEHAQERQLLNARLEETAGQLELSKAEVLQLQRSLTETQEAMSGNAGELGARLAASHRGRETADHEHALERQLLNSRLEEAAAQLELSNAEILQLQRSLAETTESMTGNVSDLDAQLAISNRDRIAASEEHALERQLLNARLEETAGQLELSKTEVLELQGSLAETKDAMTGNAGQLEARLAANHRSRETADQEHAQERELLNARLEETAAQLELSKTEVLQLQRSLAETTEAMTGNASDLEAQLAGSNRDRIAASEDHALERQLLHGRLEETAGQLERGNAEILQLQSALVETQDAMTGNAGKLDARLAASHRSRETADQEHAQERQLLNARLEETAGQLELSKTEVLQLQRSLAETQDAMTGNASELEARLAASHRGRETADQEHAVERQLLNSQVDEAAGELERSKAEVLQLQHALVDTKEAMGGNVSELEAQLAGSDRDRTAADDNHARELQLLNSRLDEAIGRLKNSNAEILQLQHALAETKEAMTGSASELKALLAGSNRDRTAAGDEHARELQILNSRLDDAAGELEGSKAEILQLQRSLAEDKNGGRPGGTATPSNSEAIDEEVARVELMIAEIVQLIEDPNTELSIVIRKNVERATLDAYLKGIFLSTGRNGN